MKILCKYCDGRCIFSCNSSSMCPYMLVGLSVCLSVGWSVPNEFQAVIKWISQSVYIRFWSNFVWEELDLTLKPLSQGNPLVSYWFPERRSPKWRVLGTKCRKQKLFIGRFKSDLIKSWPPGSQEVCLLRNQEHPLDFLRVEGRRSPKLCVLGSNAENKSCLANNFNTNPRKSRSMFLEKEKFLRALIIRVYITSESKGVMNLVPQ
jgi:hypothetical protein